MANLALPALYGVNLKEHMGGVEGISFQFHITAKCDQNCMHCYMHNSPYYVSQIKTPMSKELMIQILDEYHAFMEEFHCYGHVALTGGDPILSPYFWDILKHIAAFHQDRCAVSVLGNPFHVDQMAAKRMKRLGVLFYQISLDGLKESHDHMRKPGSFDESIRALKILHEAGIRTMVSFTVAKNNMHELLSLYDFVSNVDYIDSFGFDRMIPMGNGQALKDMLFSAKEYQEFLFHILKHEVLAGRDMIISKKERMWNLLLYELGLTDPLDTTSINSVISGCACGTGTFSVLADGTMLPCRKFEESGGKFPDKSLKDLFIYNNVTAQFLQRDNYKGCSSCEARAFCRGCPAMKYAVTGDFFAYEPYCWRCQHG